MAGPQPERPRPPAGPYGRAGTREAPASWPVRPGGAGRARVGATRRWPATLAGSERQRGGKRGSAGRTRKRWSSPGARLRGRCRWGGPDGDEFVLERGGGKRTEPGMLASIRDLPARFRRWEGRGGRGRGVGGVGLSGGSSNCGESMATASAPRRAARGRDDEETAGPADSRRLSPIPSTRRYLAARRLPWRPSICSPALLAAALRRRARRLRCGHPREESRWGRVGEQVSMSGRGERERGQRRAALTTERGPVGWGTAAWAVAATAWRQ